MFEEMTKNLDKGTIERMLKMGEELQNVDTSDIVLEDESQENTEEQDTEYFFPD